MLPGDYIAMRLTNEVCTTVSGLSEGIFWDFKNACVSKELLAHYGFDESIIAKIVPTFGVQGAVSSHAAQLLGLTAEPETNPTTLCRSMYSIREKLHRQPEHRVSYTVSTGRSITIPYRASILLRM